MSTFKVISFNHNRFSLENIGLLHLNEEAQSSLLLPIKINLELDELMLLSTCNRVEFFMLCENNVTADFLSRLLKSINSKLTETELNFFIENIQVFEDEAAIKHVFEVASSLNSLVIGEREIITQVRKAYELCNLLGLTGDFMRLLIKQTIETAKDVFTKTDIAKNPVSIVSLAYRQLRELGIKTEARIVMIGAGETNSAMANYLQKHKFANFAVFNRTLANGEKLAEKLQGRAYPLNEMQNYDAGFDVLITSTGATETLINNISYQKLLAGDKTKKVIIDLALPADVNAEVLIDHNINYIDINSLKKQAAQNLLLRQKEIEKCTAIIENKLNEFKTLHKERKIELAFGEIPKQVKAIKDFAVNEVFLKEINSLDDKSKDVLDKVLTYVEKKYNAVAMKTAKEALLSKKED